MISNLIESVMAAAHQTLTTLETDFVGKDGILVCGNCHTPKQCVVTLLGQERTVRCLCACESAVAKAEEQQKQQEQKRQLLARRNCIQDASLYAYTFEHDDGSNQAVMERAKRYCDKWDKMLHENIGILFWGGCGTGKTYAAGCIANRLMAQGVSVMATSLTRILNDLSGFQENKNNYIDSLMNYQLLFLDDLGTERNTKTALETVFSVIDARYKSNKPFIVTTNLTLDEMKQAPLAYRRIYDRVLGVCVPVKVDGESKRKNSMIQKTKRILEW